MDLKQKAIKGIVWSALQSWGSRVITLATFTVLARVLGPEAFGLVAMAEAFLAFIQIFVEQGFADALVQRHELEPEHLDTAFWTSLGIGTLMTVLTIATAGFWANLFHQPPLAPVLQWLSLSFFLTAFRSIQDAIFRRKLAFKNLALRTLIAAMIGGIVGLALAFLGFGVWSLVIKQLVESVAGILVLWWASDWRPGFRVSKSHFNELLAFGISVAGSRVVGFFGRRSDDFLIAYFLGPTALGYYAVAYRLLLAMLDLLSSCINQVAMPTFARLQKEPEQLRRGFYTVTQLTSLAAFPGFLGMAAVAPELVHLLFGVVWLPSVPVMQLLVFVGILQTIYAFNVSIIAALGKPQWNFWIGLLNTLFQVASFFIAVRSGIVAVAASYVISSYLLAPLRLIAVHKLIHISFVTYFRQYASPLLASLIMIVALLGARHFLSSLVSLQVLVTIYIAIGAVSYVGAIAILEPKLFHQLISLSKLAASKQK